MTRFRSAACNVGIDVVCRFQGLWEERDTFIVPRFSSGRHFHRRSRCEFFFVIWPIDLAWALLVSDLVTVGHELTQSLDVLLRLHSSESMSQSLVLNDGFVTDALVFAEDVIGKRLAFRIGVDDKYRHSRRVIWRLRAHRHRERRDNRAMRKPVRPSLRLWLIINHSEYFSSPCASRA